VRSRHYALIILVKLNYSFVHDEGDVLDQSVDADSCFVSSKLNQVVVLHSDPVDKRRILLLQSFDQLANLFFRQKSTVELPKAVLTKGLQQALKRVHLVKDTSRELCS
jgi:hypothetical protein